MATNGIRTLDEAILEQDFPFIHFFNGRILSGEDLSLDQLSNREARRRLARSTGSGVVHGLEVSLRTPQAGNEKPSLRIKQGLAIARDGNLLNLRSDIALSLVRTAETTPLSRDVKFFEHCQPVQTGLYIAGAGLYVLTVGPAVGSQGRAPVTGLQNNEVGCNSRYTVEGVRFRLAEIPKTLFTEAELDDEAHLRNLVAYKCFGVGTSPFEQMPFRPEPTRNPSGQTELRYGLLDEMRSRKVLSDCEVPLAVVYWVEEDVKYVDNWSVRRRVVKPSANGDWDYAFGDRRRVEAEAMVLQFQEQLTEIVSPQLINGKNHFRFLPPVGVLPISNPVHSYQYKNFFERSTDNLRFFQEKVYRSPVVIEGARVGSLIEQALDFPPIDLSSKEMLWLYLIRENLQQIQNSLLSAVKPYLVFASGHLPFMGEARFDLSRWDFANYV